VRLDWTCRRVGAVTLVELRLENDADDPRRVRVENRLDGSIRPPRRGGRPAPGWDETGYESVLDPGETRALGYACPAPPADPPAVADATPAAPDAGADADRERTAGEVVAALGDPRPPRDAVPTPAADRPTASVADPGRGDRGGTAAAPDGGRAGAGTAGPRGAVDDPPAPVTDWLDDVAGRIESGEIAPGEERALAVVGERVAAVQVALAARRER
jgi:hypothetical protein